MDLNGLISTIMSSTAALVAIIGGFLVSRVITLSSEKNGILKKIKEIDKELEIKNNLYESARDIVQNEDIDDFVREYSEDIILKQKSIDNILDEDDNIKLDREVVDLTVSRINEILEIILDNIKSTDDEYSLPSDFNEFIRDNEIQIPNDRSWHELIYDIILSNIFQPETSILNYDMIGSIQDIGSFKPILSSQEYKINVRKMKGISEDIKVLKALRSAEEDILSTYGKISGLWGGLIVLIYACIVGLIIPSFLLPYPVDYYDDSVTRIILLILFVSELIAIFSYLGVSMFRLTNNEIE